MRSTLIALAAATVAAALAAGAGGESSAGSAWSRLSGPNNTGQQLGLARTSDGTLHAIWNRGNPAPTSIFDTRYAPGGAKLGTSTVRSGWGGAGGLALLVMPDKTLRLFATGTPTSGSANGGVSTLTASARGAGWELEQGASWGGPGAAAAPFVGATLTKDGQPVSGWAGAGVSSFQVGVAGGGTGSQVCSCDAEGADVATDGSSGAVVMAGLTIGTPAGTYVERALPGVGGRVVLPSGTQSAGEYGLAGRIGAPGVYVMYSDNGHAGVTKPAARLYRFGGTTRIIARGAFTIAKPFAGPQGRLWLVWGDAQDGVFVTRSNKAVSGFEPVQRLASPPRSGTLWNAEGEGSQGPLDLFVDADAGGRGFWHTHVLAQATLRARVAKAKVTLVASDAGDPLAGASISVGAKRVTAAANGQVEVALRAGSYTASVSAPGYAAASTRFTVR